MTLLPTYEQKADQALQRALKFAHNDEPLRAIVVVDTSRKSGGGDPSPEDYATPLDYRKALIQHHSAAVKSEVGPVVSALRELPLSVHGGETSGAVVIEGPAWAIAESLRVDGVQNVNLDTQFELRPPAG